MTTAPYRRVVEISRAVRAVHRHDPDIDLTLHRVFRGVGFAGADVSLQQRVFLRGESKRFWELTLRETAPRLSLPGAAAELGSICEHMGHIADDETTLFVRARVAQT